MPAAKALTLLLINEQAEEIKQTTIRMRQSYPGCRVEAVYSVKDALEWVSKQDWCVILLDEQIPPRSGLDLLPELRRRAPSSVIIVQAEYPDAGTAAQAMRAGADSYLYKKSPAFLTELPIVTRTILDNRRLDHELQLAHERHHRLINAMPDLVYELDTEGRFMSIGSGVETLLGYTPQELTGVHCSTLLRPDERQTALRQIHERRAGPRAASSKTVTLVGKHGGAVSVTCFTFGLYNQQRQFLGTVGFIRNQTEGISTTFPALRPHEQLSRSAVSQPPAPAVPTIREPGFFYPERRQASRIPVQIESSLNLPGDSFRAVVHDISLSGLYLVVEGHPDITENLSVQLSFTINGAVMNIPGKIQDRRRLESFRNGHPRIPALGLVIVYQELGAIEGPVLASLLQELQVRPHCATLTVHPTSQGG